MSKKDIPVYQVSGEYAACLEKAFTPARAAVSGAASGGTGALAGGAMSNTPLSSSNLGTISEDTAHISIWADFGVNESAFFARLHRSLEESRAKAENHVPEDTPADDGNSFPELDFDPDLFECDDSAATSGRSGEYFIEGHGGGYMEFGGCLWKVLPRGIGGGDGRAHYPYVMSSGGVVIAVRRKQSETVSNMWVEFGSIVLARNGGLDGMWQMLRKTFATEGITVKKDILSRVDMYGDFDFDCGVSAFCEKMESGCRVSRARSLGYYSEELNVALYFSGRRHTGFSLGKNIKVRIYDKRRELENDPLKWGVFAEKYGGLPEVLTRVEFQLRRRALSEFYLTGTERIDGVDSYLAVRERLWKYLTEDWFRLTDKPVDSKNKHQSHSVVWSVWESVQNAVFVVVKEVFRIRRRVDVDFGHQANMALGCICKMAVWSDCADTWKDITGVFMEYVKKIGWPKVREVLEKHSEEKLYIAGGFAETVALPV